MTISENRASGDFQLIRLTSWLIFSVASLAMSCTADMRREVSSRLGPSKTGYTMYSGPKFRFAG